MKFSNDPIILKISIQQILHLSKLGQNFLTKKSENFVEEIVKILERFYEKYVTAGRSPAISKEAHHATLMLTHSSVQKFLCQLFEILPELLYNLEIDDGKILKPIFDTLKKIVESSNFKNLDNSNLDAASQSLVASKFSGEDQVLAQAWKSYTQLKNLKIPKFHCGKIYEFYDLSKFF